MLCRCAILTGGLLILTHAALGQVFQRKGESDIGSADEIDFPNPACREIYVTKYINRPAPKIFYALDSPISGKRECVSWVQADKYSTGSDVDLTPEKIIALLDKPKFNFLLLASEGVPLTERQINAGKVSSRFSSGAGQKKAAAKQDHPISPEPTWAQILTEGAAKIASEKSGLRGSVWVQSGVLR